MKFPGSNTITLTDDAITSLLKSSAPTLFGDPKARITLIKTESYPTRLQITFTTDPDPMAEEIALTLPSPRVVDDGHTF